MSAEFMTSARWKEFRILSMEYVDGEDLNSLLRRIGRLPQDKALEISRKLCAGLAAAHNKGVLHRDLKPGNIMIDGRGQVLITDFGLAGIMGQIEGAEARNGTPGYMAPEQLSGKEVSAQSDVYALGVVLYEIFTGRRPFNAIHSRRSDQDDGGGKAARSAQDRNGYRSRGRKRHPAMSRARSAEPAGFRAGCFSRACRVAIHWRRRWRLEKRRRLKWWLLPA